MARQKSLKPHDHGYCPYCWTGRLTKAGFVTVGKRTHVQRYACTSCHRTTTSPTYQPPLIAEVAPMAENERGAPVTTGVT